MYEFRLINNTTEEEDFIYGYSLKDAFRRRPEMNPTEWTMVDYEYLD